MTPDEYERTQSQIMLLGGLVRELPLDDFVRAAEHADAIAPLTHPSHWIAGKDKLDAVLEMARALRHFQSALPTLEEAQKLDADAANRMRRLGISVE